MMMKTSRLPSTMSTTATMLNVGTAAASSVPPLGHAVGGAIGSALALLLFYPLERARIEMQTDLASPRDDSLTTIPAGEETWIRQSSSQEANEGLEHQIITTNVSSSEALLTGAVERNSTDSSSESWVSCEDPDSRVVQSIESEGEESARLMPTLTRLHDRGELYQGAGAVGVTLAASSFVFFYAHQALNRLLTSPDATKAAGRSLLSSCVAGMLNVLITNPLWVANMRIVKGRATEKSLFKELFHIARTEGYKSLWNGTGASLLLVSNPVLQFFVYEQVKLARLKSRPTLSPLEAFCIGGIAKAVATIATYPLQLAQVLLRLKKGVGTWECLKQQFERGGIRALYTGMDAKLLQTVLTAAFTFLTYEQILHIIRATMVVSVQKKEQRQLKITS